MPYLRTKNYKQFDVVDETSDTVVHSFEGAALANKALIGDEVDLDVSGNIILKARAPHPVLAGYLELNSKTTYGLTKRGAPLYLFQPLNPAYPPFIVSSTEKDRSAKVVVLVEFLEWDRTLPRGSLKKILGPAGNLEAEEEALLWNACPWTGLTKELAVLEDNCPNRVELKGYTFNIDPEGCKDIDDCVTLLKDGEDWHLTITIADVASCVEEMGAVDCMASVQGQTLYRDGVAVRPMLPRFLSEDNCSLLPGVPRRGVSLRATCSLIVASYNLNQEIRPPPLEGGSPVCKTGLTAPVWSETTILNNKTYSYEGIKEFCLEKPEEAAALQQFVNLIAGRSITDPHEWIEVLMVYYNTEAAKLLLTGGVGILRTHEAPDMVRLEKYTAMDPSLAVLASSAATYALIQSDTTYQHWGLQAAAYCHASSPIRRYADLANQRILKQLIRGNKQGLMVSMPVSDLNQRAKISKGYERDRVFLNALLKTGQRVFDALVLDLVEEEGKIKVSLWIQEWQQKVKCRLNGTRIGAGYRLVAADESRTIDVEEGKKIRIECGINLGSSRWKDRLVITML